MNARRRILVVSYLFPPAGNVGVHRTLRFIKHLPSFGWEPIVLTAGNARVSHLEPSLLEKVPDGLTVHRTKSFEALNSGIQIDGNEPAAAASSVFRQFVRKVPTDIWRSLAAPDEKLGWVPFAIQTGRRILREQKFEAIYVTGKPFSSYLIGRNLSRQFGIPWVMDLRDLWTLNRRVHPRNRFQGWLNPRLEKRLIESAACVVANTPGNCEDFRTHFPNNPADKFVTITNGYDADDFKGLSDRKNEKFTIGYTGAFYYKRKMARTADLYETYSPKYLFMALKSLFDECEEMRERTEVVFTGPGCRKVEPLLLGCGLNELRPNINLCGWVTYRESLETLKRCHALTLMLPDGEESSGWIPSKLFQYLASGTEIVALVPPGDVTNIVTATKAGTVISPKDVEQIKATIKRLYGQYRQNQTCHQPNWKEVEKYEGASLTARLAECLGRVAADRHTETEVTA